MEELSPRTKYLIENPGVIIATGHRAGVPSREMDDFRQEVLLKSVRQRDAFDPSIASMSTYATGFVCKCARQYLKKLSRQRAVVDSELVEMVLEREQVREAENAEKNP